MKLPAVRHRAAFNMLRLTASNTSARGSWPTHVVAACSISERGKARSRFTLGEASTLSVGVWNRSRSMSWWCTPRGYLRTCPRAITVDYKWGRLALKN